MEFRCRLASRSGEIVEGVYVADTEARLRHELEEKGLFVLSLQPKGRDRRAAVPAAAARRRSDARVPGLQPGAGDAAEGRHAAGAVARPAEAAGRRRRSSARVLDDVHERVRGRARRCRTRSPRTASLFPSIYTASLLAGERSGNLDAVLRRFVEYTKIIATVKRKTVSALVYPAILVSLALVLVAIIVLKVVPAFSDFYASFGAELPLVTRIIVALLATSCSAQFLLHRRRRSSAVVGRSWPGSGGRGSRPGSIACMLGCRCVGDVAAKFATSQMARTLATLLGGGLPLVNALDIAARRSATSSSRGSSTWSARGCAKASRSPPRSKRARVFPEVAVKMAEVGESTGALQDMLNTVADFYDEEISTNMERFVTLVEPVLLVIMGIVIAGLLLALYMPLFQLSSVLQLGGT